MFRALSQIRMKLVTLLGPMIVRMKPLQNKPSCHEMRLVAMNGYAFQVTLDGVLQLLRSKLFLGTLVAFSILIALVNPSVFGITLPLSVRPVFWLLNCSLVTVVWLFQFRICILVMQSLRRDFVVPSGLFYSVSVALLIWVNYLVLRKWLALAPLESVAIWGEILRYTLIAVVFELMLVVFILPHYPQIRRVRWNGEEIAGELPGPNPAAQQPRREPAARPGAASLPDLEVQDRQIALDGLLYLKSVEHYVEFVFHEGHELLRAALRDLTEQLGPEHGVQTHRSYWVQRAAIDDLIRQNGHPYIRLKNGTNIPISRMRRKEVNEWMQRFGPEP